MDAAVAERMRDAARLSFWPSPNRFEFECFHRKPCPRLIQSTSTWRKNNSSWPTCKSINDQRHILQVRLVFLVTDYGHSQYLSTLCTTTVLQCTL